LYDTHRASWRQAAAVTVLFAFLALMVALPTRGHATTTPTRPDEAAHSEAGVVAAEDHWSRAELAGDTAFLEHFLLTDYRSVGPDGHAADKAKIVAGAAKRSSHSLAQADAEIADYRKQHPYDTKIVIEGDVAVISFSDPTLGKEMGVKSSDILVWRDGAWHALYSQHSQVGHAN
jgi:hypothetical protein